MLKVISRTAFELQPIFDTLVENAVRLCEAERAFLFRFDGKLLRSAASYNVSPELREFVDKNPIAPGRHSISARAALERRTVHVPDIQVDPEYAYAVRDERPIRTTLAVPMLKGDDLIGTITIYRLELKPFTDKQIALVETFADQAVIAIENVRLFDEIQDKNRQLRIGEREQVAVRLQHEPRAAHAAQCHHRTDRNDGQQRGALRHGKGAGAAAAREPRWYSPSWPHQPGARPVEDRGRKARTQPANRAAGAA